MMDLQPFGFGAAGPVLEQCAALMLVTLQDPLAQGTPCPRRSGRRLPTPRALDCAALRAATTIGRGRYVRLVLGTPLLQLAALRQNRYAILKLYACASEPTRCIVRHSTDSRMLVPAIAQLRLSTSA